MNSYAFEPIVAQPTNIIQDTTSRIDALEVLRPGAQWVCFNKKKCPFHPGSGEEAKANDPTTWASHDLCLKAWKANTRKYAGIGREFIKEQCITGIDLDKCLDENGKLTDYAQEVVRLLNSYTEYSPSGKGLHIWAHGNIPDNIGPDPKDVSKIEMYDNGRYFTWTGKHLEGTPGTIEERQEQLTALHKQTRAIRAQGKERKAEPEKKKTAPAAGDTPYGQAALDKECQALAQAHEGGRNHQLNISAYSLGQLIGGNELSFTTVVNALSNAAARAGLDDSEIEKTLRSGLDAGMKEPRKTPLKSETTSKGIYASHAHQEKIDKQPLPEVIITGQMREYTDAALQALALAEQEAPTLFIQSARLVKVGNDEQKRPIILHVGVAELRNALTRSADFYRLKTVRKDGEQSYELVAMPPPKELAEALLALSPSEWPFPALEAIVETPVLRPDFTILDTPGYDAATRLYYIPQEGLKVGKVSLHPTCKEVEQAVALIEDALGEFPYVSQADKANAYAAEMTPILRPAIKRHVPLALIDAPKPGTGKGLLADTIALTATGKTASILTAPDGEDEWDKRITAMLMQGRSIICIDNVTGKLQSAALDATLTADEKEGRILGLSKMVQVPNRATWLATGNNIKLGGDLPRRCYRIRLDPHVSRPWMRTGFKHEDLASWVTDHRGELIAAVLTLARAWFIAGKPLDVSVPSLGTFTNWAKMLGGILKFAGIPGFLSDLSRLYEEADEDGAQWEAFLYAWHSTFHQEWKTTAEIVKELTPFADSAENIADSALALTLPDDLQESLKEKPKSFSIVLGKALARLLEACFGEHNLRIERDKDKNTKAKKWRVISNIADSADSATTQARGENFATSLLSPKKTQVESGLNNYPHYPQQQNGSMGRNEATSHSTPLLPDSENKKPLSAQSHYPHNEQPSSADPRLAEVEQVLMQSPSLFWARHQNDIPVGTVTPGEYLRRLAICLDSGDEKQVRAATEDIARRCTIGKGRE